MPDWREQIARRLSSLKLDSAREMEIIEELSQHLEDRYHALISGGATDNDARREVLMELNYENLPAQGRLGVVRDAPHEPASPGNSGHNFFTSLRQDLRYALRQFQRNPGFALSGRVSSMREDAIEVTLQIVPGESGSPVFLSDTGEIVGMAESRFHEERSIGFALPIDDAKKFLHKVDAKHGF